MMHDWIAKVIQASPENLSAELEITAPTIDEAIRVTREMWPEAHIYSVTSRKPKVSDVVPRKESEAIV